MNKEEYNKNREINIRCKSGAVWVTVLELDGIINLSALARQYFRRSQSWLSQRIHGCTVMRKETAFKEEEYSRLAAALRDIARRLNKAADEIDSALPDSETVSDWGTQSNE